MCKWWVKGKEVAEEVVGTKIKVVRKRVSLRVGPNLIFLKLSYLEIWQSEYDNYFENLTNMTICNMTIILNIWKYDNLQYDNYFEKIVIFEFQNMTKKKPMVEHQKLNQTTAELSFGWVFGVQLGLRQTQ